MLTKIPAFIDGNTLVHYSKSQDRLFVGNDDGVLKVFNVHDPDSEPISLDAPEYLTSLKSFGNKVIITNTEGQLSLFDFQKEVTGDETFSVVFEAGACLRDAEIINEGNRVICGGDTTEMVIVDFLQGNRAVSFSVGENILGISYNSLGELVSLSLGNGEIHVYSVSNEKPELIEKIQGVLPTKTTSSTTAIDYHGEHANELVCTQSLWSSNGEQMFLPTSSGSVKSYARNSWSSVSESSVESDTLVAFTVSPSNKFIALLFKTGTINIYSIKSFKLIKTLSDNHPDVLPINLAWTKKAIYVGATNGELHLLHVSLDDEEDEVSDPLPSISEVDKLFLEEASDSETEEFDGPADYSKKRDALDDSRIIDEDDDDQEEDSSQFRNKSVEDILSSRRKRPRFSSEVTSAPIGAPPQELIPYSPGSTPWIKSVNSGTSAHKRRYLFMNAIGYSWSVKNASTDATDVQKSVTISFFDRSLNKDYHFIDYYDYDLCSMNERGVLLGCSGYQNESSTHKGRIFYRHHVNTSDSWDRQIPLLKSEYITSICITSSSADNSGDSIIVVGTNFGYLRFFNLYGLCINIMKVSPVISIISSAINTVFSIHHSGKDNYSYSIISVPEDYKFYQQECNLPIKGTRGPLIKGLFFNDRSDPCLVAGHDDTLVVLSHWREVNNARWIPVLNCTDAVSDFGLSESKKNWKSWPLGLQEDRAVCLILKNSDIYPGFPLPLPIELDLRLPTKCFKSLLAKKNDEEMDEDEILDDGDEAERKLQKIKEDDPEEEFLRVSTLGKLLASSLVDTGEDEEHLDTLKNYSLVFDKSLLKLFNSACQESRLNKAFSVVKLIKNDKALLAATKIAERHNFSNLMAKINKLREDLLDTLDAEGSEDDD